VPNLPRLFRPPQLGPRRSAVQRRQRELAERRGYRELKTSRWQRTRKFFLSQTENALCCCCKANDVVKAAELVDHIVPHHGDELMIYDPDNMQPRSAAGATSM
jgi:5-methylcytosine-specific restriction protein A